MAEAAGSTEAGEPRIAEPDPAPQAETTGSDGALTTVALLAAPARPARPTGPANGLTRECTRTSTTQLPPPARVAYRLQRGPLRGDGRLEWRWNVEQRSYSLRLEGQAPLVGTLLRQTSDGGFDRCGLAPLRHTERRIGRSERALNFLRSGADGTGDEGEIRFSGNSPARALVAGTQDRLSWLVQLAARLTGWPGGSIPSGGRIELDVAAVGGDIQHWVFTMLGREGTAGADGAALLHLRREPESPFDTHAEVWADPRHGHWPVRIELREARGDPFVLQMTDWQALPR